MAGSKVRSWGVVLAGVAVVAAIRFPASGQESQSKEDVLQALLTEVRGLRAALQQMAAAGPRVQLAMGRLQMQEQRLSATRRQLDEVRDNIASAEREVGEGRDRLAVMDDAAQRMSDATERDALGAQVKMAKAALAQRTADIQRMKEREAELTGVVGNEEARWNEISQRIDELERALSGR